MLHSAPELRLDLARYAMDPDQLADAVRAACVRAAVTAYEDAGIQGLCEEGRWEAAVGAIQSIDLRKLIQELELANTRPA